MADSISELMFSAVIEQLETILIANDYYTDAGDSVYRARRSFRPAECPAISIFDTGETTDSETASGRDRSMMVRQSFQIDIHTAAEQDDTGDMIGKLKYDVKRALLSWADRGAITASDGTKLGILGYQGADPFSRADGGETEAVTLRFVASYKEAYGDPSAVL